MTLPRVYPAYSAVYAGEDGNVWVRRWLPASENRSVFDVFSRDGTLLTAVQLPSFILIEPTPILSMSGVVAVLKDPLTGADGIVRFVPPRQK